MFLSDRLLFGKKEYSTGTLATSLGFLTRVVYVQIGDRLRAHGGLTVGPATLSFLHIVDVNPGIRQAHAARILMIQESNMATLVKNSVAQGMIERGRGTGKRSGLWITAEGAKLVAQVTSANAINREYAEPLSEDEYQQLIALLNRVYQASL